MRQITFLLYFFTLFLSSKINFKQSLVTATNSTNSYLFDTKGFDSTTNLENNQQPAKQINLQDYQQSIFATSTELNKEEMFFSQQQNIPSDHSEVLLDQVGNSDTVFETGIANETSTYQNSEITKISSSRIQLPNWSVENDEFLNDGGNFNDNTGTSAHQLAAKLKSINVHCSLNSMRIYLTFSTPFNGVVYSQNHFHLSECHYVPINSGKSEFQFDIKVNHCGAHLIQDALSEYPMLEEMIIIQNQEGIQEMWDTAQHIRCKSAEMKKTIINTALKVDMNEPLNISYTEDNVNAFMDIQLGRGPNAPPVTGVVKIGSTLTLVITAIVFGHFDIQVKECVAHNGDLTFTKNKRNQIDNGIVQMSDENGCILKPKLLTPWRKEVENKDISEVKVVVYSYLQAFKFPDKMDVNLECSIEICKKQCSNSCTNSTNNENRKKRTKRENDDVLEQVRLQRTLKVVSNEDIKSIHNVSDLEIGSNNNTQKPSTDICFTLLQFIISLVVVFVALIVSCMTTAIIALRRNIKGQLATAILMDRLAFLENASRHKI